LLAPFYTSVPSLTIGLPRSISGLPCLNHHFFSFPVTFCHIISIIALISN
jgi:hypothetical protein